MLHVNDHSFRFMRNESSNYACAYVIRTICILLLDRRQLKSDNRGGNSVLYALQFKMVTKLLMMVVSSFKTLKSLIYVLYWAPSNTNQHVASALNKTPLK